MVIGGRDSERKGEVSSFLGRESYLYFSSSKLNNSIKLCMCSQTKITFIILSCPTYLYCDSVARSNHVTLSLRILTSVTFSLLNLPHFSHILHVLSQSHKESLLNIHHPLQPWKPVSEPNNNTNHQHGQGSLCTTWGGLAAPSYGSQLQQNQPHNVSRSTRYILRLAANLGRCRYLDVSNAWVPFFFISAARLHLFLTNFGFVSAFLQSRIGRCFSWL